MSAFMQSGKKLIEHKLFIVYSVKFSKTTTTNLSWIFFPNRKESSGQQHTIDNKFINNISTARPFEWKYH